MTLFVNIFILLMTLTLFNTYGAINGQLLGNDQYAILEDLEIDHSSIQPNLQINGISNLWPQDATFSIEDVVSFPSQNSAPSRPQSENSQFLLQISPPPRLTPSGQFSLTPSLNLMPKPPSSTFINQPSIKSNSLSNVSSNQNRNRKKTPHQTSLSQESNMSFDVEKATEPDKDSIEKDVEKQSEKRRTKPVRRFGHGISRRFFGLFGKRKKPHLPPVRHDHFHHEHLHHHHHHYHHHIHHHPNQKGFMKSWISRISRRLRSSRGWSKHENGYNNDKRRSKDHHHHSKHDNHVYHHFHDHKRDHKPPLWHDDCPSCHDEGKDGWNKDGWNSGNWNKESSNKNRWNTEGWGKEGWIMDGFGKDGWGKDNSKKEKSKISSHKKFGRYEHSKKERKNSEKGEFNSEWDTIKITY